MTTGEGEAVVCATGADTFIGRAVAMMNNDSAAAGAGGGGADASGVQKLLTHVGGFCCAVIAVFIAAVAAAQWGGMGYDYRPGVSNLLVLLIGRRWSQQPLGS